VTENELTFRDFAGAIMEGNLERGGEVLQTLLSVDASTALGAAEFFQRQMQSGGPDFMMKAMGMRTVVTEGTEEQLIGLLGDCFNLHDELAGASAKAVLARYRN
jgi:hypothetical protein